MIQYPAVLSELASQIAREYHCTTVLDYNGMAARCEPADLVVCTNVLEHIESDQVFAVVGRLVKLTRRALFVVVALDGRPPHVLLRSVEWWRCLLAAHDFVLARELQVGPNQWAAVLERPSCA
jgi:2-polyprenyl-3-methyl-5-hydroxy-6-metoxy-1,4-benzoquinol methylase